jgi:hypothetical protein
VAIVRKRMSLNQSKSLRISQPSCLKKRGFWQVRQVSNFQEESLDPGNQLILFDF